MRGLVRFRVDIDSPTGGANGTVSERTHVALASQQAVYSLLQHVVLASQQAIYSSLQHVALASQQAVYSSLQHVVRRSPQGMPIDRWMDKGSSVQQRTTAPLSAAATQRASIPGSCAGIRATLAGTAHSTASGQRAPAAHVQRSATESRARRSCAFAATAVTVCSARFGLASHVLN